MASSASTARMTSDMPVESQESAASLQGATCFLEQLTQLEPSGCSRRAVQLVHHECFGLRKLQLRATPLAVRSVLHALSGNWYSRDLAKCHESVYQVVPMPSCSRNAGNDDGVAQGCHVLPGSQTRPRIAGCRSTGLQVHSLVL